MRNPQLILDALCSHSKVSDYKFERLYRILFNEEMYYAAYERLQVKTGNLTPGTDGDTMDGMSTAKITRLIDSLKDESYSPHPARRAYIPKKNGKMRPLGIPSWNDKLVQEVVRMILQAIYEGSFSDRSHGFRPHKSCHTALTQIQKTFTGVKWFIEGDIRGFFDNIDHAMLIDILRERIADERFLRLIWKFLRAGYVEDWKFHDSFHGTPQGGIISPILANIYLDRFDRYMKSYAATFNKGNGRGCNPEYFNLNTKTCALRRKYRKETDDNKKTELAEQISVMQAKLRTMPCHLDIDAGYRRIVYTRYADDFLIGVIGTKADCESIKADIATFMRDRLKLELSAEKTLITHGKDIAKFLGYDITVSTSEMMSRTRNGILQRNHKGKVQLLLNSDTVRKALEKYGAVEYREHDGKTVWCPKSRGKLIAMEEHEIVRRFNSEIRGFYHYYSIAANCARQCSKFGYLMEYSMCRTLAQKLNLSTSKVKRKYTHNGVFTVNFTRQDGKSASVTFYNEGFAKKSAPVVDAELLETGDEAERLPKVTLIARLKSGCCEMCGKADTELRMYHAKRLGNIDGTTQWGKIMLKMGRKTLAVCDECYRKIHNKR